jgi:hypothetical protein
MALSGIFVLSGNVFNSCNDIFIVRQTETTVALLFFSIADIAIASALFLFCQTKEAAFRIRRQIILSAIILITTVIALYSYSNETLWRTPDRFSLLISILNSNVKFIVIILIFSFYWMNIWRGEEKRKTIYIVHILCLTLSKVQHYISSFLMRVPQWACACSPSLHGSNYSAENQRPQ